MSIDDVHYWAQIVNHLGRIALLCSVTAIMSALPKFAVQLHETVGR
jgi:hypothetical protein